MNAGPYPLIRSVKAGTLALADAETRLKLNRDALRRRLAQMRAESASGQPGALTEFANASLPLARQTVRQHPYASMIGAALAGMILMRWKPWRGLGGSFLMGVLTRQALAASASSAPLVLNWLMAAVRTKRKAKRAFSNTTAAEGEIPSTSPPARNAAWPLPLHNEKRSL